MRESTCSRSERPDRDLHRALDAKPNALVEHTQAIRQALEAIVSGQPLPIGERRTKVVPTASVVRSTTDRPDRAGLNENDESLAGD